MVYFILHCKVLWSQVTGSVRILNYFLTDEKILMSLQDTSGKSCDAFLLQWSTSGRYLHQSHDYEPAGSCDGSKKVRRKTWGMGQLGTGMYILSNVCWSARVLSSQREILDFDGSANRFDRLFSSMAASLLL